MSSKTILSLLIGATLLLVIKVYVANEIYYTSRDIQKLSQQINALKEERNILKLKIEKLKYKNTIVDPLFNYLPTQEEGNKEANSTTLQNTQQIQKEEQVNKSKKPKDAKELFETIDIGEQF